MEITIPHCIVLTTAMPIVMFVYRFGKELHTFPTASKLSWSFSPIAIFLSTMSTRSAQYGSRQFVISE